jgi:hypothetical protein
MPISKPSHHRHDARDVLIAELEEFAAHRGAQGKTDRAGQALAAAEALRGGATGVFFERQWLLVGEPDRYTMHAGTREDVVVALESLGQGSVDLGAESTARQAARALHAVQEDGETMVRVGATVYEVIDDGHFAAPLEEVMAEIKRRGMRAARLHLKAEERELMAAQTAIESGATRVYADGRTFIVV